jgi:hypothetical protein
VDFVAVVDQVIALLRQRGRVTYRTLQLQFTLDDAQLATLKDELLYSQPEVVDDAGRGLVPSAVITQRVALVAARRISLAVSFSCMSIESVLDDH